MEIFIKTIKIGSYFVGPASIVLRLKGNVGFHFSFLQLQFSSFYLSSDNIILPVCENGVQVVTCNVISVELVSRVTSILHISEYYPQVCPCYNWYLCREIIFGLVHPLLDISATVDQQYLDRLFSLILSLSSCTVASRYLLFAYPESK